jgi:hypothetical protein
MCYIKNEKTHVPCVKTFRIQGICKILLEHEMESDLTKNHQDLERTNEKQLFYTSLAHPLI